MKLPPIQMPGSAIAIFSGNILIKSIKSKDREQELFSSSLDRQSSFLSSLSTSSAIRSARLTVLKPSYCPLYSSQRLLNFDRLSSERLYHHSLQAFGSVISCSAYFSISYLCVSICPPPCAQLTCNSLFPTFKVQDPLANRCCLSVSYVVFRYPCSRKSFTHTCRIRFFVCSLNLVAIGPHLCLLKFQIKSSYDSASGLHTKHNSKRRTSSSSFLVCVPGARYYGLSCFFQTFLISSISKKECPKNQTYFL